MKKLPIQCVLCSIAEINHLGIKRGCLNDCMTEYWLLGVQYPFKLKSTVQATYWIFLPEIGRMTRLETDGQFDKCYWDLETATLITISHHWMQCAKPHTTPGHVDLAIFTAGLQSHQSLMFGSHTDSHQWYPDLRVLEESTMRLYESASTHWVIIYLSYWSSQNSTRVSMFVSDKEQCLVKSFSPSRFLIYLQVYGQAMSEWQGKRVERRERGCLFYF